MREEKEEGPSGGQSIANTPSREKGVLGGSSDGKWDERGPNREGREGGPMWRSGRLTYPLKGEVCPRRVVSGMLCRQISKSCNTDLDEAWNDG